MPYRVINRIFPRNPDNVIPIDYDWKTIPSQSRGVDMTRSISDNTRRSWLLQWSSLTQNEATAIVNFYHAMSGGYNAFLFCPFTSVASSPKVENYSGITGTVQAGGSGTVIPIQNAPDIDDYYNDWIIEISSTQKIISDYDGFNKKITCGTFGSDQAGNTYTLHHLIGTGTGSATSFALTRKYDDYSETKKYVYDESTWVSGGTLSPASSYVPKLWTHDGITITTWSYDDTAGGANTFKMTTINKYANNVVNYFVAPLICNVAPTNTHSVVASWYYCYLVRFAPDLILSEEYTRFNVHKLRQIQLVEVLES